MAKLWTCRKCKRKFEKINQSHSCRKYPLKNHFIGKERAEQLFKHLVKVMKTNLKFSVDSVECCIHLVKTSTFLAVFPLKDKIRLTFALPYKLNNKRVIKYFQASKNRYHTQIEISDEAEIDKELLTWIKEAYTV